MQVKNAVSASLLRQSDILSRIFFSMKYAVWYAVCQGNYSEFQLNAYRTIRQVKQIIQATRRSQLLFASRRSARRHQGLLGEVIMNLAGRELAHIFGQLLYSYAMLPDGIQILAKQSHHPSRRHNNYAASLFLSCEPPCFLHDLVGKTSI